MASAVSQPPTNWFSPFLSVRHSKIQQHNLHLPAHYTFFVSNPIIVSNGEAIDAFAPFHLVSALCPPNVQPFRVSLSGVDPEVPSEMNSKIHGR